MHGTRTFTWESGGSDTDPDAIEVLLIDADGDTVDECAVPIVGVALADLTATLHAAAVRLAERNGGTIY